MTTNKGEPIVYLSEMDEERFKIKTARAAKINPGNLFNVIGFCIINNVSLLIARCLCSELKAVHAMEQEDFLLMDTLIYYSRDLINVSIPQDVGNAVIRPIKPSEEDVVKAVTSDAFRGYLGHYHADERLEQSKCDEVYPSWLLNACKYRDDSNEVLVADLKGTIVGFCYLRLNSVEEGEFVLGGIDPDVQRLGIYRSIIIQSMEWFLSKGVRHMLISTQITNIAAQKAWVRLGLEPRHAYYTFHKWFD